MLEGSYGPPGQPAEPCPSGSYCPAGAASPTLCPDNNESPPKSAVSTACTVSCDHARTQLPQAGHSCIQTAMMLVPSRSSPAPRDSRHPENVERLRTSCLVCDPAGVGLTGGREQALRGFYGSEGQPAEPCPSGSFCPAGAASPTPCPANTESASKSATAKDCTVSQQRLSQHRGAAVDACGHCSWSLIKFHVLSSYQCALSSNLPARAQPRSLLVSLTHADTS